MSLFIIYGVYIKVNNIHLIGKKSFDLQTKYFKKKHFKRLMYDIHF